jgi:C-terminal processing protease CtpA/Prc
MNRPATFVCLLALLSTCVQAQNKISPTDKVLGLSKFWMEVNYNFVYLENIGREKWDSAYAAAIPKVLETPGDYEYYRELQRFCALLKDGHTNVFGPFEEGNSSFGEYRIGLRNFQNRAIIAGVNLSKKDELPIGSEIVEVNGMVTQDYVKACVAPYISASAPHILADLCIERLLRGRDGDKYDLQIKTPAGKVFALSLVHAKVSERETYPPMERQGLLDFKWYDNQVAYIALNSFANPKIDTLFVERLTELYKAKGLIIDLRNNGGGSSYIGANIFRYLTDDSLIQGARASTRNHIAAFKAWGVMLPASDTLTGNAARGLSREEVLKYYLSSRDRLYYDFEYVPQKNGLQTRKLVMPTVILIGHNTASAAEDFLIAAQNQNHMVRIGERTFGSTGQPYEFRLPGGGRARVCTLKATYPDGTEFVGCGVKPDIEVAQTLEDYLQKKDPGLDKGLEYLKRQLQGK